MTHSLFQRPQLATAIAAYIALWNMTETAIAALLDRALGPPSRAYELLGPLWSIKARIDFVERELERHPDQAWATRAQEVLREIDTARLYRNKLVHGLYGENQADNGILLIGNMLDSRRNFTQESITAATVMSQYRSLESLIRRLLDLTAPHGDADSIRISVPSTR